MEKEVGVTSVFKKILNEYSLKENRIVILEGGTGSSKTYSLAQLFIRILFAEENARLTIARKTFPALRATAMKDFFSILKSWGAYREELHNKSENIYRNKNSEVDFLSVDEPTRIRSRRRDYLWLNEANEFTNEDFEQLNMRTGKQIFMDYNPSYQWHWIYDKLQTRKDCIVIPSTYKDNPFLEKELVKEIEGYRDKDQNYWRIYGLGLRGLMETLIYTHWKFCDELPENYDRRIYGLDFGFNNATALMEIREKDKDYYWKEKIYQSHLTNDELIGLMKEMEISRDDMIYSEHEPAYIQQIKDAGFNIVSATKDVRAGINYVKSHGFYITKDSVNTLKEAKSYSWKIKDGKALDEPVKVNDHAMDAGRYGEYSMSEEVEPRITILGGSDVPEGEEHHLVFGKIGKRRK